MSVFEKFENGKLFLSGKEIDISTIPWHPLAKFEGVALKHLITAKETSGVFSYHLVRILPNNKIGLHLHETQLETHEVIGGNGVCTMLGANLAYDIGIVTLLPAGIEHEVQAGKDGLLLFAKFIPALC